MTDRLGNCQPARRRETWRNAAPRSLNRRLKRLVHRPDEAILERIGGIPGIPEIGVGGADS